MFLFATDVSINFDEDNEQGGYTGICDRGITVAEDSDMVGKELLTSSSSSSLNKKRKAASTMLVRCKRKLLISS